MRLLRVVSLRHLVVVGGVISSTTTHAKRIGAIECDFLKRERKRDCVLLTCRAPGSGSRSSWPRRERNINGNRTSRNASEPTHRGLIPPLSRPPDPLPP